MNPEAVALLNTHAMDEDRPDSIVGAGHVVVGLVAVLIDQSELNPCRPWRPEPEGSTTIADASAENRGVLRHWQRSGHI
jgi:hypothetical protein